MLVSLASWFRWGWRGVPDIGNIDHAIKKVTNHWLLVLWGNFYKSDRWTERCVELDDNNVWKDKKKQKKFLHRNLGISSCLSIDCYIYFFTSIFFFFFLFSSFHVTWLNVNLIFAKWRTFPLAFFDVDLHSRYTCIHGVRNGEKKIGKTGSGEDRREKKTKSIFAFLIFFS